MHMQILFYLDDNLRVETVFRKINSWNPTHYLYQVGINYTRFRRWLSKSSPEVMDSCARGRRGVSWGGAELGRLGLAGKEEGRGEGGGLGWVGEKKEKRLFFLF